MDSTFTDPATIPDRLDRLCHGTGAARVEALIRKIRRVEGDYDALEGVLREANLPRLLRYLAEDADANFRESTPTHDGGPRAKRALTGLTDALGARGRSRPYDRARAQEERTHRLLYEGWAKRIDLTREAMVEVRGRARRRELLASKLRAESAERPDLLRRYEDGHAIDLDPVREADELLENYGPLIEHEGLTRRKDIDRLLKLDDAGRRARGVARRRARKSAT